MIVLASLFAFVSITMVSTKLIYDSIFGRYEIPELEIPQALAQTVEGRETLRYDSGENTLQGYLYRSQAELQHDGLIVLVSGLHACADAYLWQIQSLLDYGWSVFAFDATGSCHSEGDNAVGFSQILLDTEQTLRFLESRDCFGYESLVLMGHSRGGYAACCALRDGTAVDAVISVSGVNSAMEGVVGSAAQYVGPVAYGNYGGLWLYQTMLFGSNVVGLEACEELSRRDIPALIIHGQNDETVPIDQYSVFSHSGSITGSRVEYIVCDDPGQDGHTNLLFQADGTANRELMAAINDFLVKNIT